MKTLIQTVFFALLALSACSQTNIYTFKAALKVVDESGYPLAGALATIGYYTNGQPASVNKLTETNRLFEFQDTSPSEYADYSFEAKKDDYYGIWQVERLQAPYDPIKWNLEKTLVLKKVGKPTAMYAKRVQGGPPVFNEPVGYDLMIGDWVGPRGKGISTDVIFFGKLDQKSKNDFDYELTVKFPKEDDGIQEFLVPESEKGSGLRSPHAAPENGYQVQVVKSMHHHPGLGAKDDMDDPNRNYFFRVRTVKNSEGKIVSAHYGKIYGDFMQFTYYLNPTPNDRNIEFEPKQNLIQGLQSFEQISAP